MQAGRVAAARPAAACAASHHAGTRGSPLLATSLQRAHAAARVSRKACEYKQRLCGWTLPYHFRSPRWRGGSSTSAPPSPARRRGRRTKHLQVARLHHLQVAAAARLAPHADDIQLNGQRTPSIEQQA
jgi:hypothetical protein